MMDYVSGIKRPLYVHDVLNRLTHIHCPDSAQDITYSYDGAISNGLGHLTGMSDPLGTTTYSYTSKGEIYQEVKTFTGLSGSFTTAYSYDANGNTVSENSRAFIYDQNNRLIQVTEG